MSLPQPFNSDRVAIDFGDEHPQLAKGVAHVRLTRADKMNALDPAMFNSIIAAGHALHQLPGLRAVVLSGEGKSFCAGLDMASMAALGGGTGDSGSALTERIYGNANMFQQVSMLWRKLPVPVVAAIHGVCFGGGLQIASGADIRIITPDARLSIMEMKWGIIPDMGGFVLWPRTVRDDVLRELTYSNREFSGAEAVTLGFATRVHASPVDKALFLATEIAGRNPAAIAHAKALFNRLPDLSTDEILMDESVRQQQLVGTANQIEAVMAQMQKRAPNFVDR